MSVMLVTYTYPDLVMVNSFKKKKKAKRRNEPVREKTNNFGILTRSDTNLPVQSQKKARSLKFRIKIIKDCIILAAKTKALISSAVTAQLI